MGDAIQNLFLQLTQGQVDLQNSIQALANAQQGLAAPMEAKARGAKKIVTEPGNYNGSPQMFRVWWSKMKLWVSMNQRAGLLKKNSEVMAAVLSQFEGPKAGHWAQVKLEYYMGPNVQYPTWDELQVEITGYFVPGNNADWARSQLLKLCQEITQTQHQQGTTKNVRVVVCLCGVQRGYTEEGGRGSTPTG